MKMPSVPTVAIEVMPACTTVPSGDGLSKRMLELDGLRGFALLLVISKHYDLGLPGARNSGVIAFLNHFYFSFSGADFFIVLMGFLLGGILLDAGSSPNYYRTFFLRRGCRIAPLYYLTLLLFTAAVLLQEPLDLTGQLNLSWPFDTPWSMAAYAFYLQNFWMTYDGSLGPPWLAVTWSLAVIEQFYLFLPWLLRQVPRYALAYVLTGLFLAAPLCRLVLPRLFPSFNQHFLDRLPFCRTDTLCAGVLAALLIRDARFRKWLTTYRSLLCPLAALMFGGFAFLAHAGNGMGIPFTYVVRYSYLAVFYVVLILIGVFASQGIVGALMRFGPFLALGRRLPIPRNTSRAGRRGSTGRRAGRG